MELFFNGAEDPGLGQLQVGRLDLGLAAGWQVWLLQERDTASECML